MDLAESKWLWQLACSAQGVTFPLSRRARSTPSEDLVRFVLLFAMCCESCPSLQLLRGGLDEARMWLDMSETRGKEMY